jgi:GNAT superfamily N-acetyltransferase
MANFSIRTAAPEDAASMLMLLTELADYEKLPIGLTEAQIARDFFGPDAAVHCDLAFAGDQPVGIATWFWTYRSFKAARGIFIEDLYVRPACRGKGHGKALLRHLAAKAQTLGAARLEWLVLDWNAPSIEFYKSLGASQVKEWLTYRLDGPALQQLAQS